MRASETLGFSKIWHVHSATCTLLGSTSVEAHPSRCAVANMILCRALLLYLIALRKKKCINHWPVAKFSVHSGPRIRKESALVAPHKYSRTQT